MTSKKQIIPKNKRKKVPTLKPLSTRKKRRPKKNPNKAIEKRTRVKKKGNTKHITFFKKNNNIKNKLKQILRK